MSNTFTNIVDMSVRSYPSVGSLPSNAQPGSLATLHDGSVYVFTLGSWSLVTAGSGANNILSNLTNPTAINQNLVFNPSFDKDLSYPDNSTADSTKAASFIIESQNKIAGTGDGGDVNIAGGSSEGGQGGTINISAGSGSSGGSIDLNIGTGNPIGAINIGGDLLAKVPGTFSIGVGGEQTSGTDYRFNSLFLLEQMVIGNILGTSPPYGLNNLSIPGVVIAGTTENTNSAIGAGANALFNSESLSFYAFIKDVAAAHSSAFVNQNNSGDYDVYFSLVNRNSARQNLLKFGSDASLTIYGITSGGITQKANATTTNYTINWPNAQGSSNSVPMNDGSGNLSWQDIGTAYLDNAAAASIPGTVVKKIQIFNSNGTSLGYLPIYSSIT